MNKIRKYIQLIVLLFFLNNKLYANSFSEYKIKTFEKFANELIQLLKIPGAAISIVSSEKALFEKTYGVKKKGQDDKITKNTIFRIGSISKSITSLLVYKLLSKGIDLEDPISKYIPELVIHDKLFTEKIRLKHILNHSVGLKNHCLEEFAYLKQSKNELFQNFKNAEKICEPGIQFKYQNVAFSLIAPLLENVFKEKFEVLLKQELLNPLNLSNTLITESDYNKSENISSPHIQVDNKFKAVTSNSYYYNILPAAGVSSSISDMSKFLIYLLNEIKNKSLDIDLFFKESMNANYKIKILEKRDYNWKAFKRIISWKYGLGFYEENYSNHKLIFHSGRLRGFRSTFMFDPDLKIGIIILTNSSSGEFITILRHFFADLLYSLDSITIEELKKIF
ncbi:MAG: beta-lactamase family protein [Bacteroidetes bacterium]|nr:beta-lactamase family protein [Bacteroidota bacterium]